jgi:hypothetical protein
MPIYIMHSLGGPLEAEATLCAAVAAAVGAIDVYENNSRFSTPGGPDSLPLAWKGAFGQPVFSEPPSLTSMILRDDNKMGASTPGGVVYTGSDDVFAYAHYGRAGKLIWRTSPAANNMMATRWSLANFNIFRRASLSSISDQLR